MIITEMHLEYAMIIFEHLFNYNHMRDEGYKDIRKLYTRDGEEISTIDLIHQDKTIQSFVKRNGTKFGFEVDKEKVEHIDLEQCYFVVTYRKNNKLLSHVHWIYGSYFPIDDRELTYLINQIAL